MSTNHLAPDPTPGQPHNPCGLADPAFYRIRVHGCLDDSWSAWFGGLTFADCEGCETVLSGLVVDQAALYGLLIKLFNMGLVLLEVLRVSDDPSYALS